MTSLVRAQARPVRPAGQYRYCNKAAVSSRKRTPSATPTQPTASAPAAAAGAKFAPPRRNSAAPAAAVVAPPRRRKDREGTRHNLRHRQNYASASSAPPSARPSRPRRVRRPPRRRGLGAYRPDPTSARPLRLVPRPFTYEDTRLAGWACRPARLRPRAAGPGSARAARGEGLSEPAFGATRRPGRRRPHHHLGGAQRRCRCSCSRRRGATLCPKCTRCRARCCSAARRRAAAARRPAWRRRCGKAGRRR